MIISLQSPRERNSNQPPGTANTSALTCKFTSLKIMKFEQHNKFMGR